MDLFRSIALSVGFLFSLFSFASRECNAQGAKTYTVIDGTTGYVFEGVNTTQKAQVGSLTKVATAMVVLDWAAASGSDSQQVLGQQAIIPDAAVGVGGVNSVGLQPGDRVSLRDLLYAALMQSDNIAALTLADHVGRTLPVTGRDSSPVTPFVVQMNALGRRLGMQRTLFLNPHGLDSTERKLPYSTAADMARLAKYAVANSAFRFYVSQKERTINISKADGGSAKYSLRNTNELVGTNGIDGVKTGTTRRAGECLIVSAERAPESIKQGNTFTVTPRRLIVVILDSPDRFGLAKQLLSAGWDSYDQWAAAGRPMQTESR